jgi:hypothetical protein
LPCKRPAGARVWCEYGVNNDALSQAGDIDWSWRTTLLVGLAAIVIGLITALLGVGGGVLTVPMLLELGVISEVRVRVNTKARDDVGWAGGAPRCRLPSRR